MTQNPRISALENALEAVLPEPLTIEQAQMIERLATLTVQIESQRQKAATPRDPEAAARMERRRRYGEVFS
ncbi:MAG: hypothetical protein ACRD3W_23580 [Terriglobales bacterium]